MRDQRTTSTSARVAVIADEAGAVGRRLERLRARPVPGYVLDTAPKMGTHDYDLVHVFSTGPAAAAALAVAGERSIPIVATYAPPHETPADYELLGVPVERIVRWMPGVDLDRFHPARFDPGSLPSGFNILAVGPLDREHGADLLAEAFPIAHERDPRIRLVLVGTGPERGVLGARFGGRGTFLGEPEPDALPTIYATADLLVCTSTHAGSAEVILEAQASGLPVLAVESAVASELIESGRSGCLVAPEPELLASAIGGLSRRETLCDRLATGGLMAVRERSAGRSNARLAEAYTRAIATARFPAEVARAA